MSSIPLSEVLTQEHRAIDAAIARYLGAPSQEKATLIAMLQRLRCHIYFEETTLFPPMMRGPLVAAGFAMLREHGALWRLMDAIDAAIAAGDQAQISDNLDQLATSLERHNIKEEPIFYTAIERHFPSDSTAVHVLASPEMPLGWRAGSA